MRGKLNPKPQLDRETDDYVWTPGRDGRQTSELKPEGDRSPSFRFTICKGYSPTGGYARERFIVEKTGRVSPHRWAQALQLAQAKQDEYLKDGASVVDASAGRLTLEQVAVKLFTDDRTNMKGDADRPVSTETTSGDWRTWETYLRADFGHLQAKAVQPFHVTNFLAKLRAPYDGPARKGNFLQPGERYSFRTIASACNRLKFVLQAANVAPAVMKALVYKGLSSNNEDKVDIPLAAFSEMLDYFKGRRGYRALDVVRLAILWQLGPRPGELAGLFWSDFDGLDANDPGAPLVVTIKRALRTKTLPVDQQTPRKKRTTVIGKTKNGKVREVQLSPELRPWLREWRTQQTAFRLANPGLVSPDHWFVTTNLMGTITHKQVLGTWWTKHAGKVVKRLSPGPVKDALDRASLYSFRHTFGARALEELNADTRKVAYLMGNTPEVVMRAYQPLIDRLLGGKITGHLNGAVPADGFGTPDEVAAPAGNVVKMRR